MIGRRNFLKVLGIGTASAPLAAKIAADQEVANLTVLRGHNAPPLAVARGAAPHGLSVASMRDSGTTPEMLSTYVRTFGLPAHVERQVRINTRYVHSLDPDIACKRSWSLNVKIQEQRRRNYEDQVRHYSERDVWQKAQEKFKQVTGLDWWW